MPFPIISTMRICLGWHVLAPGGSVISLVVRLGQYLPCGAGLDETMIGFSFPVAEESRSGE